MIVPQLDLAAEYRKLRAEIDAAVQQVFLKGAFIDGAENAALEHELAECIGAAEVICVNSGTDALLLSLKALGIGAGDEVIVPTLTFTASASVIRYLGAEVVLVDVEESTRCIDLDHAERPSDPRTRVKAHLWKWNDIYDSLLQAREKITISSGSVERRVIRLVNPGMPENEMTTHTMLMSFQLIQPGEVAPGHRHTMAAIRFILQGKGAYTNVDGQKMVMEDGDLILTPQWSWHEHAHEGKEPMVWIDGHFTAPRAREWQTNLAWDEPERITYAQADGTVVFEVLTFRGRRHGPGCSATGNSHG